MVTYIITKNHYLKYLKTATTLVNRYSNSYECHESLINVYKCDKVCLLGDKPCDCYGGMTWIETCMRWFGSVCAFWKCSLLLCQAEIWQGEPSAEFRKHERIRKL